MQLFLHHVMSTYYQGSIFACGPDMSTYDYVHMRCIERTACGPNIPP